MSTAAAAGSPGVLRLRVVAGNAAGSVLVVEDSVVFGRESDGPGALASDPELSRSHARISRESTDGYTIEDLASTNGTFVNGARLHGLAVLARGDRIEMGGTTLEVVEAPAPPAVDVRAATVALGRSAVVPSAAPAVSAEEGILAASPPPAPRLELTITVDFERAEATIELPGADPVRLRGSGGRRQPDNA